MRKKKSITWIALLMTVISAGKFDIVPEDSLHVVYGKEAEMELPCYQYEFEGDSHYELSDEGPTGMGEDTFGMLSINGEVSPIESVNGVLSYEVTSGNVSLEYLCKEAADDIPSDEWHIAEDKSKTVDGVKLDENIGSGALILQTSLTGEDWITEAVYTDILNESAETFSDFYTTREIQQINGCYYRIIVAYKMERQIEDKKYWFVSVDNFEYKKYAEVYEFYLINSSENAADTTSPSALPRRELGTKINTGKDNGFSGNVEITRKDPHYGWDIGTFFVNGYTRETTDGEDLIFLKNVGDRVTLWFLLSEDITCLNGDKNLSVSEDTNGYDQYFEIDRTNFKHGTLIIRYTDHEGVRHEPVIYTDFLAANACTGANTKVELFEEGDYEVALDYEIKEDSWVDSYTNYRIFFTFQIRNGNCMVYPFDTATGSELADHAITENGFKLDMARSRYLTIDVTRTILRPDGDGYIEDVRFNRPAKDGDVYVEEGIYTFTVKNLYTDSEPTTKQIYVGSSPILRALSSSGLSLQEINELLAAGAEISEFGQIEMPSNSSLEELAEAEAPEEPQEMVQDTEVPAQDNSGLTMELQPVQEETETFAEETEPDNADLSGQGTGWSAAAIAIVVTIVVVAGAAGVWIVITKKKKVQKTESVEPEKEDND
ncbi:MAG: hypothetical protein NC254_02825 [bacterium]|nr:hypothetical protein [bacterium]